ncbi:glycosyl hydrolase family 28-related protein [Kribbella sp. CA-245084]|uniref:glycosyl hydrolase family 28-related protein n=1 Tax=Kribbella sp. CA-245084 TaxID=3239940 RepID=UPI003D9436F9
MTIPVRRRTFLAASAAVAATGVVVAGTGRASATPAGNLLPDGRIRNLPASFYQRDGLEEMPRLDYESMAVANVRDHGAAGDGVASDVAAFNAAVESLTATGGGIVYLPPGRYHFPPPPVPGIWAWQRPMANVHFVGEGDASVIAFTRPKLVANGHEAPTYTSNGGWEFQRVDTVSLRDLAMTWAPWAMVRHVFSGSPLLMRAPTRAHLVGVTVDHCLPGIVWNDARDCYMVDSTIRNGAADGFNFGGANNCVGAYCWSENTTDDAFANYHDQNKYPDSNAIKNVRLLHNTLLQIAGGRGITMGGSDQTVAGNWIETCMTPGVLSDISSGAPGPGVLQNAVITDNTVIRANFELRPDNRQLRPGGGYHGTIAMLNQVSGLTVTGNTIKGSEEHDITFGIDGWNPARLTGAVVERNELLGARSTGLRITDGSTIDGLRMNRNEVLATGGPAADIGGDVSSASSSGNKVEKLPVVTGDVDGDIRGFTPTPSIVRYVDPYQSIRAAGNEQVWIEPKAPSTKGLRQVDVRDFGAKGNGVADDTGAFRAALAALPAIGGVIFVPAGKYLLKPDARHQSFRDTKIEHHFAVAERDNVHLAGSGDGSEILFDSPDHQGIRFISTTGCSIKSLKLTAVRQPELRHNRSLLDLSGAQQCAVSDLTVDGASGANLLIDSCRLVLVSNVRSTRSNNYGIQVEAGRQILVTGCTVTGNRDGGIQVGWQGTIYREAQQVRIVGNTVADVAEGGGICISSGSEVRVSNNTISGTSQAAVYLYGRAPSFPIFSVTIEGNTISQACSRGLTYTPGAISIHSIRETQDTTQGSVTVTGNSIADSPFSGVWVGGQCPIGKVLTVLNRLTITGNTFSGLGGQNVLIFDDQKAKIANLIVS